MTVIDARFLFISLVVSPLHESFAMPPPRTPTSCVHPSSSPRSHHSSTIGFPPTPRIPEDFLTSKTLLVLWYTPSRNATNGTSQDEALHHRDAGEVGVVVAEAEVCKQRKRGEAWRSADDQVQCSMLRAMLRTELAAQGP